MNATLFNLFNLKYAKIFRMRHCGVSLALLVCLLGLVEIPQVAGGGLTDPRLLGGLVIRFEVNPDLLLINLCIQGPEKTWVDQLVWKQIDNKYSRKEAASSSNPLSSTFS